MKILNIAVHSGGGIGTTLKNFLENDTLNQHTLACLNPDDPRSEKINVPTFYNLRSDFDSLDRLVEDHDIVILHWYNNPLYFDLLINNGLPPCRLAVWSHASCLHPPYVLTSKLVDISDKFILTSPVTYEAAEYRALSSAQKDKFGVIWSVADMTKFQQVKTAHDTFNIGYAGTIDFASKLHSDFVDMCKEIKIPNVKFIFCSSGPDIEKVKQQVQEKGLSDKFVFTGRVDDLSVWFAQMDVFGYPLYEKHYGTCEQVLGEAMSAGAIPVLLDNPAEKYIVRSGFNGLITTREQYAATIMDLYRSPELLNTLSSGAQSSALTVYSTDDMIDKWNIEFNGLMVLAKKKKRWPHSGAEIFKESLGDYRVIFDREHSRKIINLFDSNLQWSSESKGSIKQYSSHFPDDFDLQHWLTLQR